MGRSQYFSNKNIVFTKGSLLSKYLLALTREKNSPAARTDDSLSNTELNLIIPV
jgi:hypothetical protein